MFKGNNALQEISSQKLDKKRCADLAGLGQARVCRGGFVTKRQRLRGCLAAKYLEEHKAHSASQKPSRRVEHTDTLTDKALILDCYVLQSRGRGQGRMVQTSLCEAAGRAGGSCCRGQGGSRSTNCSAANEMPGDLFTI